MSAGLPGSLLTVLMPVRNAAAYVDEALESLRRQTLAGVRVLAMDDGSTDGSAELLKRRPDENLEVVATAHRGLVATLNAGLDRVHTPYVARMDADDRSAPERLQRQLAFLESHPDHVLVGSARAIIHPRGHLLRMQPVLETDAAIRPALAVGNCFVHGSVMFRRDAALRAGGYRSQAHLVEDYDFWRRLAGEGKLANLREPLYEWRANPMGVSLGNRTAQRVAAEAIGDEIWDTWFGAEGPAPHDAWDAIWRPDMDRSLAADLHLLFARGYIRRDKRAAARAHVSGALALRPLSARCALYLGGLALPASVFLAIEARARDFLERWRRW